MQSEVNVKILGVDPRPLGYINQNRAIEWVDELFVLRLSVNTGPLANGQ